jgi:ribosomal protein L11 methylase PrmA
MIIMMVSPAMRSSRNTLTPGLSASACLTDEFVITGGAAFGTGEHPTTSMCVEWLEGHLTKSKGAAVLDYGCGSGILGRLSSFRVLSVAANGAHQMTGCHIQKLCTNSGKDNILVGLVPGVLWPVAE